MKIKSYKFFGLALFFVCIISCSKEKDNKYEEKDYYIKYEANFSSYPLHYYDIEYTVATDKGIQTFISGNSFSEIFGPVEKGFTAKLSYEGNGICNGSIYVSKGSEPFSLKEHQLSNYSKIDISYTIE